MSIYSTPSIPRTRIAALSATTLSLRKPCRHCLTPRLAKILYRAAVEQVPNEAYHIELSKAEVISAGSDVTCISYGNQLYRCSSAISKIKEDLGISVELIDLRTLYPWDRNTILESVQKTGRAVVVYEDNAGVGVSIFLSSFFPFWSGLGTCLGSFGLLYEVRLTPNST